MNNGQILINIFMIRETVGLLPGKEASGKETI